VFLLATSSPTSGVPLPVLGPSPAAPAASPPLLGEGPALIWLWAWHIFRPRLRKRGDFFHSLPRGFCFVRAVLAGARRSRPPPLRSGPPGAPPARGASFLFSPPPGGKSGFL